MIILVVLKENLGISITYHFVMVCILTQLYILNGVENNIDIISRRGTKLMSDAKGRAINSPQGG